MCYESPTPTGSLENVDDLVVGSDHTTGADGSDSLSGDLDLFLLLLEIRLSIPQYHTESCLGMVFPSHPGSTFDVGSGQVDTFAHPCFADDQPGDLHTFCCGVVSGESQGAEDSLGGAFGAELHLQDGVVDGLTADLVCDHLEFSRRDLEGGGGVLVFQSGPGDGILGVETLTFLTCLDLGRYALLFALSLLRERKRVKIVEQRGTIGRYGSHGSITFAFVFELVLLFGKHTSTLAGFGVVVTERDFGKTIGDVGDEGCSWCR